MISISEISNSTFPLKENNSDEKIIKSMILTYFNPTIGPIVFATTKKGNVDLELKDSIVNLMDIKTEHGKLFIFGRDDVVLLNQLFVINSRWGRGGIETLMITFVIYEFDFNPVNKKIISNFAKSFIEVMRRDKELYQGFYQSQEPVRKADIIIDKATINEKAKRIKDIFNSVSNIFTEYPFSS